MPGMTKPHEETWTSTVGHRTSDATNGSVWHWPSVVTPGSKALFQFDHASESKADDARATLAAQAPAMARLLQFLLHVPETPPADRERIERVLRAAGVLP